MSPARFVMEIRWNSPIKVAKRGSGEKRNTFVPIVIVSGTGHTNVPFPARV